MYRSKRRSYIRSPYVRKTLKRARSVQRRFPRASYGAGYFKRGDQLTLETFGATQKEATEAQQASRKAAGFTGHGGYFGQRAGDWMSGMTGISGLGAMGSRIENRGLGALQSAGNKFLNGYTGKGAYESNALINPNGNDALNVSQSGLDATSLNVKHREYIGDVMGSSVFNNTSYLVNPGSALLFPWLSQIATNFDEYEFNQLIFGFKSVTADVTTATVQIGSVIMAANYNATSLPFTAKIPMMEYESSASAKITDNLTFGVECDPTKNGMSAILYITPNDTVPAGQDPKTYFLATMQIAVNQTLATGEVGEFWVEYDVTLRKKKLFTALGGNIQSIGFRSILGANCATSNIFGLPNSVQFADLFPDTLNISKGTIPCYYSSFTAANAQTVQQCRTQIWTQANKNTFQLVYMAGTNQSTNTGAASTTADNGNDQLILYFPDNYAGNFRAGFDVAGITFQYGIGFRTNCIATRYGGSGAITDPAVSSGFSAPVGILQNAVSSLINGPNNTGYYIVWSFVQPGFNAASSTIIFSGTQISLTP